MQLKPSSVFIVKWDVFRRCKFGKVLLSLLLFSYLENFATHGESVSEIDVRFAKSFI
jgi:hypothetical protein